MTYKTLKTVIFRDCRCCVRGFRNEDDIDTVFLISGPRDELKVQMGWMAGAGGFTCDCRISAFTARRSHLGVKYTVFRFVTLDGRYVPRFFPFYRSRGRFGLFHRRPRNFGFFLLRYLEKRFRFILALGRTYTFALLNEPKVFARIELIPARGTNFGSEEKTGRGRGCCFPRL